MKKHIFKFLFGNEPLEDQKPVNAINLHFESIKKTWDGVDYDDFGMERIFRLFLISARFLFPGIYLDHAFGKVSITAQKAAKEIYVLLKMFFPFFILYYGLSPNPVFLFFNVYFLIETFIVIFDRIYLSEHSKNRGYKRILLLLFINFLEVVFSFGVLYASGDYLNKPLVDYIDAIYFSLMTSATIGYGDIHPINANGKLISIAQSLSTLAYLVLFFNFFSSKRTD